MHQAKTIFTLFCIKSGKRNNFIKMRKLFCAGNRNFSAIAFW